MHLKDVAASAPRKVGEFTMPPPALKEVGLGTPGDPMDSVRKSVAYLHGLAV